MGARINPLIQRNFYNPRWRFPLTPIFPSTLVFSTGTRSRTRLREQRHQCVCSSTFPYSSLCSLILRQHNHRYFTFQAQISHLSSSNLQNLDMMQKSCPIRPVNWAHWTTSVPYCNFRCPQVLPLTFPLLLRPYPTRLIPHCFCKTLTGRLLPSLSTSSRLAPRSRQPRLQVQVILP
jgi:hypothetical protein